MKPTNADPRRYAKRRLLPPRALLYGLLLQLPAVVWWWPLDPGTVPIAIGIAMLCAGIGLNVWSERLFRQSGVGVCPFSPAPALVTNGPYRVTRNPMYVGLILISAAVPLITGTYWNLGVTLAFAGWLHFSFVLPEEEFLQDRLGGEYGAYASHTPRWLGFPAVSRERSSPGVR